MRGRLRRVTFRDFANWLVDGLVSSSTRLSTAACVRLRCVVLSAQPEPAGARELRRRSRSLLRTRARPTTTKSTRHVPRYLQVSSSPIVSWKQELTRLSLTLFSLLVSPRSTLSESGEPGISGHLEGIAPLPQRLHAAQQDGSLEDQKDE